jgi:hypothetical protein
VGVLHDKRTRLFAIAQAVIGAAVLAIASPAAAQLATGTVTAPASGTLGIPVTATVAASCQFNGAGPSGSYNVPNLNAAFSNDFDFSVSCSSAFRVGVVSSNGALVAPGTVSPGYTASAPYTVSLDLKGDTLDTGLISCDASTLTVSAGSPCASFRGPSSTTQGLRLGGPSTGTANTSLIRVSAPTYSGANTLIASSGYTDTLTVTISASP